MGEDITLLEACHDWRGLFDKRICVRCGGAGTKTYANTTTWRNSVGGDLMTQDA
jgi:hypothetical protein